MDTATPTLKSSEHFVCDPFEGNSVSTAEDDLTEGMTVPAFKYDPLRDAQIRVLTVLPAVIGEEDMVECSLEHVELRQNGHSCLSYCWGTDKATHVVRINGQSFSIRPNLYQFLCKARRSDLGPLWIDAICINQSDHPEKSAQVQNMGEIYSFANATLLWLGVSEAILDEIYVVQSYFVDTFSKVKASEELNIDSCFETLTEFLQEIRFGYSHRTERETRIELANKHSGMLQTYGSSLKLLAANRDHLVAVKFNAYWNRAWIVEEILRSPNPVFLTSKQSLRLQDYIHLHDLLNAINLAKSRGLHIKKYTKDKMVTKSEPFFAWLEDLWTGTGDFSLTYWKDRRTYVSLDLIRRRQLPLSINDALRITGERDCIDTRDRIFSICALLAPHDRIEIDYEMDHESLFHEMVSICIRSSQDGKAARDCAELLFPSLSIGLPRENILPKIQDLLQNDFKPPSIPQEMFWAEPGDGAWYTGPWRRPYGLYLPIQLTGSRHIILEILVRRPRYRGQPDYSGEFAKARPYLAHDLPDRAWSMIEDRWELCTHELFAFQQNTPPDIVGLFGDAGEVNALADPDRSLEPSWRRENDHSQSVESKEAGNDLEIRSNLAYTISESERSTSRLA